MNVLDLFSGIGGFSLGLERAGFRTVAFCEIDDWCRRLLAKRWPGTPIYDDVRNLTAARLRADGIERVDAICGGFPCQDISTAGKGAGLDGERSGLWREYARLVGELRPRLVFVENVGALRGRGLAAVLGDFAALGYDAEWHAVPAAAVGAPHLRDRVWIVAALADADSSGPRQRSLEPCGPWPQPPGGYITDAIGAVVDPDSNDGRARRARRPDSAIARELEPIGALQGAAADAAGQRLRAGRRDQGLHGRRARPESDDLGTDRLEDATANPAGRGSPQLRGLFGRLARSLAAASTPWERTAEPPLRRVDDGLPAGVDGPRRARLIRTQDRNRVKALGNAVVPEIPELLGRAALEALHPQEVTP